MTLSDACIRRPVMAWMLMLALIVFGALGYSRLGVSLLPEIEIPSVTVRLNWEGAAPESMEGEVVDLVEDAVMQVEGIQEIASSVRHGEATITIEFGLERDIDAAREEVQARISQVQNRLPRDVDPPIVTKINPADQPIMWIGLMGPRSARELSDVARYRLRDEFQKVPGVGDIFLGYLERNVRIWLRSRDLLAQGLSVRDVVRAIQEEHVERPAGRLESASRESNVRFEGEALDLQGLKDLVVSERDGAPVRLGDVAFVQDGLEDRRRITRIMGVPAQGLGIRKQREANAVAVARAVRAKVDELRASLRKTDPDLDLVISFDSTRFIEEAVAEIQVTLLLSAVLTGLVCWAFLGSFRPAVNVLLAIPTSILGTFGFMHFAGFTLNTFTLLALSLAVGIVVDDAIMVLENIVRRAEGGEDRRAAAREGTRQIAFAAMAATAALVAIFLPIAFVGGIIGRLLFSFGVTLSIAVALSYLEAVTLTPARCAQFLEVGGERRGLGGLLDAGFRRLGAGYRAILARVLRSWRPVAVVAAGFLVFAASIRLLGPRLGFELAPAQDQSRFLVRIQTPVGSSIDLTDRVARECEAVLAGLPELDRYYLSVGGFGGGEVNTGMVFVTLVPPGERPQASQQAVMSRVRGAFARIPGVRAAPQDPSVLSFGQRPKGDLEFTVQGPDWTTLAAAARRILDEAEASGAVVDGNTDYQVGMPEAKIRPLRDRAADVGVRVSEIADTVNALVGGIRVGRFAEGARRYDMRLRLVRDERLTIQDLQGLYVRADTGDLHPLSDVAQIEERPTLQVITRRGRERAITIWGNVAPGHPQEEGIRAFQDAASRILPPGYRLVPAGAAKTFGEARKGIWFVFVLGLAVSYMILAAQFNTLLDPFAVLLTMPFAVSGALLALWLGGQTLNLYSMLGIVLLMGIVKKNGILLVDFARQLRESGMEPGAAILEAAPVRLRPILMTSVSTIAGAIPPALALGPGAELRVPMALAVLGGVAVSTVLTLFVVPAFLSLAARFRPRRPPEEAIKREVPSQGR